MSSFWAKFSEPLPNVPIKSNNASAIFGGHSPYGLRSTEPSIFRPRELPSKSRKAGRSNSDAGLTKTVEKQKTKDTSSRRKLSESRLKSNSVQNSANSNRPVSPRSNGKASALETTDENNLADSPDSGGSNGDRYPLFISVKKVSEAEVKPRKPANELNNEKPPTTPDQPTDGQTQKKVKRSSSFSATRRPSESSGIQSKSLIKPRAVTNQQTGLSTKGRSPVDSFRREKSDIIVRPRGSCSPSSNRKENSELSNSKSALSPTALKREKSDITSKRSHAFGILRENSDLVRPRGSASPISLRREKSDLVSPHRTPGIGKRQKSDLSSKKRTGNTTPDSSTDTINSSGGQSETFSKAIDKSYKENMSKIPTPAGANPPSKIPSFSKTSSIPTSSIPQSKIPPKSKIPSIGKADKKDEQSKKSQIPTGIPRSDKSVGKIPGPPRPDSAKENKDPVVNRNQSEEEVTKQGKNEINKVSRIPSAKGASTVSKIPRQDSQGKKPTSATEDNTDSNVTNSEHETVTHSNAENVLTPQSRIPSLSSPNQTSNIPVGLSKIPSFSKTNNPSKPSTTKTTDKSEVVSPVSKIPYSHGIGQSNIPPPSVHSKESGIRKPETVVSGIPKPEVKASATISGIPKPEVKASPTSTESKIPQFSHSDSLPKSKIPGLPGSVLTRKLSEEKSKKTFEKPAEKTTETPVEETSAKTVEESVESPRTEGATVPTTSVSPSGGKVAPPPPPRQDVKKEGVADSDSPMDKFIFSEAKRMEELLRNESIVVEVPSNEAAENENKTPEKPKDVQGKAEIAKLHFEKGPEAKELTTGVGKVCDVSDDGNKKESVSEEAVKKEQVLFSTFGKREESDTNEKIIVKETSKQPVMKADTKKDVVLGIKKDEKEAKQSVDEKTDESKEKVIDTQSPVDESKVTPAIDTLGQYEQQSRRSRSRQRKVISPDSEEPETTFEQATSEDDAKKAIDKDKFGTQPFESDTTMDAQVKPVNKPAKIKSKHDKPKFVIESSLGADFYQSKTSQSKENITEDAATKPSEVIVIQNKTFEDSKDEPEDQVANNKKTQSTSEKKSSGTFEDVDLSSNKGSKMDMRAWSMDQLDEKTVKCACGRGGKCSIM